jgi:hypothetical protein
VFNVHAKLGPVTAASCVHILHACCDMPHACEKSEACCDMQGACETAEALCRQLRSAAAQAGTCWKAVAHSCGQLRPPVELTCSPWQACAAVVPAVPTLPHAAVKAVGHRHTEMSVACAMSGHARPSLNADGHVHRRATCSSVGLGTQEDPASLCKRKRPGYTCISMHVWSCQVHRAYTHV